jgi:hypothetical protein
MLLVAAAIAGLVLAWWAAGLVLTPLTLMGLI